MAYGLNTALVDRIAPLIGGLQNYAGITQQGYGRQLQMTPDLVAAGLHAMAQRQADTARFIAEARQRRQLAEYDALNNAIGQFGYSLNSALDRRTRASEGAADRAQRERESQREADTRLKVAGAKETDPQKQLNDMIATGLMDYYQTGNTDMLEPIAVRSGTTVKDIANRNLMGGSGGKEESAIDTGIADSLVSLIDSFKEVRTDPKLSENQKRAKTDLIKSQILEIVGPDWDQLSNETRKEILSQVRRMGLVAEHFIEVNQRSRGLAASQAPAARNDAASVFSPGLSTAGRATVGAMDLSRGLTGASAWLASKLYNHYGPMFRAFSPTSPPAPTSQPADQAVIDEIKRMMLPPATGFPRR